jgi:type IV secretory pathway TraG/TraD family ATPase VirD4
MLESLTHGWSSVLFAFGAVQVPMVAGLVRGRAPPLEYLGSPLVSAALTGITALGMAAASPLFTAVGAAQDGFLKFAVGTTAAAALGYVTGLASAERKQGSKIHQRGAVVAESPKAKRPRRGRDANEQQITLAGNAIPVADETKHFKLIGTTGTGKSTAIQEMLTTALARGDRAVIADPDGGYMRRFYDEKRGDVVLNPFDPRSVKWDLFAEIKSSYDVDQLARSLIPEHDVGDPSWRGYARTFFGAVTRQAHEAGITDMGELFRLLLIADRQEIKGLVRGTPAQPFLEEHNFKMFDSIRSVTSSAVGALEYVAKQKAQGFSIRQWVSEESPGVLFIPYKAGQIATLGAPISAWMRLAIFEKMDQDEAAVPNAKGERRLWFVVDELDALGKIDGLKDALARLRKFGGRCVLGFQSVAQVSSTYGQGDAHTIVENCANTLILRCSASEGGGTARFASQLIGEREVLRTTTSTSRRPTEIFGSVSESEHFDMEAAVLPAQVEQLPDLEGYLKLASDPHWRRVHLDVVRRWREIQPSGATRPPAIRMEVPERPKAAEQEQRTVRPGPTHERE